MAGERIPRGDGAAAHLGDVSQVCLITSDFMRTIDGLVELGIGPWRLMRLGPHNVTDQLYRGQPATSEIRVGLARCGRTEWEVITPVSGPSIHADWLATHGDGVHHVAMRSSGASFEERLAAAAEVGAVCVQSGSWSGIRFAYLDTVDLIGTYLEMMDVPEDFHLPDPDEWYPHEPR